MVPWEHELHTKEVDNKPLAPHKVIGNIYYVGTADYASFLITSDQGHILINPDFDDSVPLIQKSVEQLGFKFRDVKILLISHAHGDHAAGAARVKELTGAQYMVMDRDAPTVEAGGRGMPATKISRVLHDRDEVKLGGNVLTAVLTAGHTKGCTTWSMKATEAGKTYDVVIVCSVGWNPGYVLFNNKDYPQIADDYVRSFATLRKLPCDVFLAAHGNFYDLEDKYKKLQQGGPNPFVDHAGYLAYIDLKEKQFFAEFERQKKGGKP
jgi:metallo-beta-lactamase class B